MKQIPHMGGNGISPRQELLAMVRNRIIEAPEFDEKNLQPSSLDLRLGDWVKCVRTSFLPTDEPIEKTLERYKRYDFNLSDNETNVLERDRVYVVPLMESVNLPEGFSGAINPKSSTGRPDVMTRVLVDGVPNFDTVRPGPRKLFIEITPLSWNVRVKRGMPITQLRTGFGSTQYDEASLRIEYAGTPLLYDYDKKPIPLEQVRFRDNGIELTVDVQSPIVAYKAKTSSQIELDMTAPRGALRDKVNEFWEPIERPKNGELVLEPDHFYILSTRERTSFPHLFCGTLEAYDPTSSEGRTHYAGFVDAGFGYGIAGEFLGTPITLEVRVYHKPFRIVNGQPICVMKYHRKRAVPVDNEGNVAAYGVGIYKISNYQKQTQGLNLGKQFLPPLEKV